MLFSQFFLSLLLYHFHFNPVHFFFLDQDFLLKESFFFFSELVGQTRHDLKSLIYIHLANTYTNILHKGLNSKIRSKIKETNIIFFGRKKQTSLSKDRPYFPKESANCFDFLRICTKRHCLKPP